MSVFRPRVTRSGKTTKAATWSFRCRRIDGKLFQENGFRTRGEAYARREEVQRSIRLGLDPTGQSSSTPLIHLLGDFRKALEDKGITPAQVKLVTGRIRRILGDCLFYQGAQLDEAQLMHFLASFKTKGASDQTIKHYLRSIKQFTRFLHRHRHLSQDPFLHIEAPKVLRKKHQRRPLTNDESRRLLETTLTQPKFRGLTGQERAALYFTALKSGLRASELASLRVERLLSLWAQSPRHPGCNQLEAPSD